MRKMYNEYFYVPTNENVRERVVEARLITTIVIVLFCLAAMSFSAYGYFSCNVTSNSNIIQAANFEAKATFNDKVIKPESVDRFSKTYSLSKGEYNVKLTKDNNCTAETGFCIIYIGNDKYYTLQIGADINAENENREEICFSLKVNEPTKISIESHWGTSSYYVNSYDEKFVIKDETPIKVITVGNAAHNTDDKQENEQEENTENKQQELDVTIDEQIGNDSVENNDIQNIGDAQIADVEENSENQAEE